MPESEITVVISVALSFGSDERSTIASILSVSTGEQAIINNITTDVRTVVMLSGLYVNLVFFKLIYRLCSRQSNLLQRM